MHKKLAQYDRTNCMRKLASFEASEIVLDDDQNDEMHNVVQSIGDNDLEKLYLEGEEHGVFKIMKNILAYRCPAKERRMF